MDHLPADGEKRKQIIDRARKGSIEDISNLARNWQVEQDLLKGDSILSIFLEYLNSPDVPTQPIQDVIEIEFKNMMSDHKPHLRATLRAFWCLWGLARSSGCLKSATNHDIDQIIQAWPGIFKWSAFFYKYQVESPSSYNVYTNLRPKQERTTSLRGIARDLIAAAWCSLALCESIRKAMLERHHDVLQIAIGLWFSEENPDANRSTLFGRGIAFTTFLIQIFLGNGEESSDRIVSASGRDFRAIAEILLERLKITYKSPEFATPSAPATNTIMTVIMFFTHTTPKPKYHEDFLASGAIPICVKLLTRIASIIHNDSDQTAGRRSGYVRTLSMAFAFIRNFIEATKGVPWVLQAINSGFISAFVECSPMLLSLPDEEFSALLTILTEIFPRYLAYGSVVRAMDRAFRKLKRTERLLSLRNSKAWEAFDGLARLTAQRFRMIEEARHLKMLSTVCNNPKCRKIDPERRFRRCANCTSALYCSPECQIVDWREFNHKRQCILPPFENNEVMSARNREYLYGFNTCEADAKMPYLRRLAAIKHPGVPLADLMLYIDYNVIPAKLDLQLRSKWIEKDPELYGLPEVDQQQVGRDFAVFTLVIAILPRGRRPMKVITNVLGGIWVGMMTSTSKMRERDAEKIQKQYCRGVVDG